MNCRYLKSKELGSTTVNSYLFFLQDIESSKFCEVGEILDAHMGDNKHISTWR